MSALDVHWYLETLVAGMNKYLDVRSIMMKHAGGENRSLLFEVKDRHGMRESYGFFVDFGKGEVKIVEPWQVKDPTAVLTMLDVLIIRLLQGKETLHSMIFKGYDIDIKGQYFMRDLIFLDNLLAQARRSLETEEAKERAGA